MDEITVTFPMVPLIGVVCPGYGDGSKNFAHIVPLIEKRIGIAQLQPGTLNVRRTAQYFLKPDGAVSGREYNHNGLGEVVLLQRCVIEHVAAVIVRPHTHEAGKYTDGFVLEVMGDVHFRTALKLNYGDRVEVEVEGDEEWWRGALRAPHSTLGG